jgi:hypothetical protein
MSGKPPGIDIRLRDGIPCFVVSPLDKVADTIWDAVREAINANMLPEQFKREVAEAWRWHLEEDAKEAVKILSK